MNTKEKLNKYYNGIKRQESLYYEDDSIGGVFNYEKIEIGICGVDERLFLQKVANNFEEMFVDYSEQELEKMPASFAKSDKSLQEGIKLVQILHHEALHVLQTFNLQACNEHMYWIRNFKDLEFAVFSLNIMYGGDWKFGEKIFGESCWNWILTKEEWINKQLSKYNDLQQGICDNFTNLESKRISTIDLVEGEAFAFQELTTGTIGEEIFKPKKTSVYKKAFHLFSDEVTKGDNESKYLVFILVCHLSLKFGSSRYVGDEYTASAIFEYLLKSSNNYIEIYNSPKIELKTINTYKKWLYGNEYTGILNEFQTTHFLKTSQILDLIEQDVLIYFRTFIFSNSYMENKEDLFYSKTVQHFDRKMKPIKELLEKKYQGFSSKYYIALLIAGNNNVLRDFVQCVRGEDILDLEIKSPNGRYITLEQDNYIFQIMTDFQKLLENGGTYCCEEHGFSTKKRTIMKCGNSDSLRMRFKNLFGPNMEIFQLIKS